MRRCTQLRRQLVELTIGLTDERSAVQLTRPFICSLRASVRAAVVSLYGIPDHRFAAGSAIGVPVQLHFGSGDTLPGFSDPKSQEQLEAALTEATVPHEFYRYPGCGHSFANPTHSDPVEKAAAIRVKERAQQFFMAKLN